MSSCFILVCFGGCVDSLIMMCCVSEVAILKKLSAMTV